MRIDLLAARKSIVSKITPTQVSDIGPLIAVARVAWLGWRRTSLGERIVVLSRWIDALEAHSERLAWAICRDVRKPISQAVKEVSEALDEARYLLARAAIVLSPCSLGNDGGVEHRRVWEPYGVVAVITPSNFPLELSLWGIVGALVAGNVVVFKPSEQALTISMLIAEFFSYCVPQKNVLELVVGAREQGQAIVSCDCNVVWFVGSTEAGRNILAATAGTFKKPILELGGSAAAVIFEDADPNGPYVRQLFASRFSNSGQVCSAVKRMYVHESLFGSVVARAQHFVDELIVGPPENAQTQLGPVASGTEYARLLSILDDARSRGATIYSRTIDFDGQGGAYYIAPTIVTEVNHSMRIMKEEVFGPILPIMPFRDEEQALALANDSIYGLSAFVVSKDGDRLERMISKIQAGRIYLNSLGDSGIKFSFEACKSSGFGRHQGDSLLLEFASMKYCKFDRRV